MIKRSVQSQHPPPLEDELRLGVDTNQAGAKWGAGVG